jgi:hypothetical protein
MSIILSSNIIKAEGQTVLKVNMQLLGLAFIDLVVDPPENKQYCVKTI